MRPAGWSAIVIDPASRSWQITPMYSVLAVKTTRTSVRSEAGAPFIGLGLPEAGGGRRGVPDRIAQDDAVQTRRVSAGHGRERRRCGGLDRRVCGILGPRRLNRQQDSEHDAGAAERRDR